MCRYWVSSQSLNLDNPLEHDLWRRRPLVARTLPTLVQVGTYLVELDPDLVELVPKLVELSTAVPDFSKQLPTWVKHWPDRVRFRPTIPNLGRVRANFSRTRAKFARARPTLSICLLPGFGPNSAEIANKWPSAGRICPTWGWFRPNSPNFLRFLDRVARTGGLTPTRVALSRRSPHAGGKYLTTFLTFSDSLFSASEFPT